MVRKLPTETFQAQAEVELGSWDKRRIVGDISGPLTESGVLRGRVVLLSEDSDSYVDHGFTDKKGFYGVLEALPREGTKIGLSLQYQKNRFNESFGGVPLSSATQTVGSRTITALSPCIWSSSWRKTGCSGPITRTALMKGMLRRRTFGAP
jgi:outer membrane receptor for ferric coprogen and ferric-rhodotorulic acid